MRSLRSSSIPACAPTSGTLALAADGSFTYTPASGFEGTATFSYRASDGALSSDAATVTITVTGSSGGGGGGGFGFGTPEEDFFDFEGGMSARRW